MSFSISKATVVILCVCLGVGLSEAKVLAESFVVNGNKALNTNKDFRKIDGHPRMSIWGFSSTDPDQQFDRRSHANGGTMLVHRSTGKCINIHYLSNGSEFNVYPCNSKDPDQSLNIIDLGGGFVQLQRRGTNQCIDAPNRTDGGKVHMWTCDRNNANQRWQIPSSSSVSGNIDLPFLSRQTWYVCQGYNGTVTHKNNAALDLTVAQDFGANNACWAANGNVSKSAGRAVVAPADGTIYHIGSDLACLSIDQNRSLLIGHMNRTVASGRSVTRGQVLGYVSAANKPNGSYSHIHIEARKSSKCRVGTTVPFTAQQGFQFRGVGDLPLGQTHWKRALTRP